MLRFGETKSLFNVLNGHEKFVVVINSKSVAYFRKFMTTLYARFQHRLICSVLMFCQNKYVLMDLKCIKTAKMKAQLKLIDYLLQKSKSKSLNWF